MTKKLYIAVLIGLFTLSSIVVAFYIIDSSSHVTISSARELKINPSEIGEGWEGTFIYIENPVKTLGNFYNTTNKNSVLQLLSNLRKYNVKDGYLLILRRENPRTLAEVDVFVFKSVDGAREFFKYISKSVSKSKKVGIGDESLTYTTETSHVWLTRKSNAIIRTIVWDGEKTGKIILEKILEKTHNR